MKSVIEIQECTGCTACKNACPFNAINMEEDREGFLYAYIDESKCKKCGVCEKTCPVLNCKKLKYPTVKNAIAAYNKDNEERNTSSSGGIFPLLAKEILKEKGIVIGCTLKDGKAIHIAIKKEKDLELLKGAKYIQSEMNDIFATVKEALKKQKVLFVGTPCQVAGIKSYTMNHKNLITCELVCHGVPSYKSFNNYLKEKIGKDEQLIEYKFKDKKNSWKNYDVYIKTNKREISENVHNNEYMIGYLNECYTRESCFDCKFRGEERVGDITLGDFWGINYIDKAMDDDKGTSLVFINSEKGNELFSKIKEKMILKNEDKNIAFANNTALLKSPSINNKEKFQKDYQEKGFLKATDYFKENKIIIALKKLKSIIKKIIR